MADEEEQEIMWRRGWRPDGYKLSGRIRTGLHGSQNGTATPSPMVSAELGVSAQLSCLFARQRPTLTDIEHRLTPANPEKTCLARPTNL